MFDNYKDYIKKLPLRERMEIEENINRKDFTQSELAELQANLINKFKQFKHPGSRTDLTSGINVPQVGRVTSVVADLFGENRKKVEHRQQVFESGDEELIREMDVRDSVNIAYRKLKIKRDEERIKEIAPELELKEKYKTIVIDPPWRFYGDLWGFERRAAPDYGTLNPDEIYKYVQEKVLDHIDGTAHIYLWVINNRMGEGLQLLKDWGFDFKTIVTWCKPSIGLGHYFRNNTEHMLFAVKGSLGLRRQDMPTWFQADRSKHSVKPDEAYTFIEKASHPPYLDVFAREKREGWRVMGVINGDV